MSIHSRIKQLRKTLNLTQAEFATFLGINQGYVASIENEKKTPSALLVKAIAREYFVREEWLLTGEDPIHLSPEEAVERVAAAFGVSEMLAAAHKVAQKNGLTEEACILEARLVSLDNLELTAMLEWFAETWMASDARMRGWLAIQFEKAFPEYKERIEKKTRAIGESPSPGN